jgi:hypothetical protein
MTKYQKPIEKIDWRHRVATVITEDSLNSKGDVEYGKGTPVTRTTFVKYYKREIGFGEPSATALFLNQSYKSFAIANKINPFLEENLIIDEQISTTRVFDYLEAICASIIFAYTALEAFTNEEIPDSFVYEDEETTDSGIIVVRQYDKDQIEKKFSLSEKLASVLPKVKNIPSPKGENGWDGFVQLKRLRDRIIHMKSKDRQHSKHGNMYPESIWSDLLNPNQQHYPSIAKSMILYFKPKDSVHWLKYCPF